MTDVSDPLLSICLISYNQEKYIAQAIESILDQQVNFPIEIVIGEDCSTDNTRKVAQEYAAKFSEAIKLLPSEFNVGVAKNFTRTLSYCKGKYIHILEGDDYWNDPHKLQIQVDFLEENPSYVLCYHDAMVIDDEGKVIRQFKLSPKNRKDYTSKELITSSTSILTLTTCFRNILHNFPPEFFWVLNSDNFIFSLLGNHGKAKYLGNIIRPAVYRVHSGGVWSQLRGTAKEVVHAQFSRQLLRTYYARIGQEEYAKIIARALGSLGQFFFKCLTIEEIYHQVRDCSTILDDITSRLDHNNVNIQFTKDGIKAKIYLAAALALFSLKSPAEGCDFVKTATELDPLAWKEPQALESAFIDQARYLEQRNISNSLSRLQHYNQSFEHCKVSLIESNKLNIHKVQSSLCLTIARRAYRSKKYLTAICYFCKAVLANPQILKMTRQSQNM